MLFLSGGLSPGPLFLNGRTMTSQSLCSPWEQVAFFRLRYFLNRRSVSVLLHFVVACIDHHARQGIETKWGEQRRLFDLRGFTLAKTLCKRCAPAPIHNSAQGSPKLMAEGPVAAELTEMDFYRQQTDRQRDLGRRAPCTLALPERQKSDFAREKGY